LITLQYYYFATLSTLLVQQEMSEAGLTVIDAAVCPVNYIFEPNAEPKPIGKKPHPLFRQLLLIWCLFQYRPLLSSNSAVELKQV
jgi:hypothetical protein